METEIQKIYERRFSEDIAFRKKMWEVLCRDFFQKFIPPDSAVLEIAAGYCEFINNINARSKIAVDINEDTIKYASNEVKVIITNSTNLTKIEPGSLDRIFISNFFEHISKNDILDTLKECNRVLKKDGQVLILQPNIRYVGKNYWMFFDHITPLDHFSLIEALEITNYNITLCINKFLPYTTKSRLPKSLFLIRLYLKIPLLWKIFGGQSFIIAAK